jgi:hypothetical protein
MRSSDVFLLASTFVRVIVLILVLLLDFPFHERGLSVRRPDAP